MNPKAVHTTKTATKVVSQQDRDAAKQCLIVADRLLKEGDFERARHEVAKAQKLDPSNPYTYAFLDRIAHFEEQKKKEAPPAPPATPPTAAAAKPATPPVSSQAAAQPPEEQKKPAVPVAQKPPPVERKPDPPPSGEPKPSATPAPKPDADLVAKAARPVIADVLASRTSATKAPAGTTGIAEVIQQVSDSAQHGSGASRTDVDAKLDEMKRQIEMLTKALESERKVREEMNQQQLKGAIKQLRTAMEKAWVNGAPKDQEMIQLKDLATGLGIPEDVFHTVNREVKLDMYSRAVKEVVAKQKLLRNSSRTLEWLRKVYQVTMDEYLEYESKFLMDLVADQYRGTILFVSVDEKTIRDVGQALKASGYAVVNASSPENALEKIEKINPHFILCDMEFPEGNLSGIKFLHVLRANSKFNYIPFILLCSSSEIEQLKSSELRPTEGYVQKPPDFDRLNEVMNEKLNAFRHYLSSL